MRRVLAIALATAAMGLATPAAAAVTFTATNGSNLSASASFDIVAGNLVLTLTNTSSTDVNVPAEVLHALMWDMSGSPVLTYTDADICGSCSFVGSVSGSGTDVGAEWAFLQNSGGLGGGVTQAYGVSSAGYGIFGPGNVLGGASHPDRGGAVTPPDGGDFGILSAGYSPSGDNGGLTNNQPYIQNSVVFNLGAFNGSLNSISNLRFQYGTALTDPSLTTTRVVPEPGTWGLMLLGFAGVGMAIRRSRKRGATLMQIA